LSSKDYLVSHLNQRLFLHYLEKQNQRNITFYARKQLLLSARLSHRSSVCPSVCHAGGSVKNGAR